MKLNIATVLAFSLVACSPTNASEPRPKSEPRDDLSIEAPSFERPADTTFEDVLAEYQYLNQRLTRVAAPLRIANAELCGETYRDPGFSLHRLSDYPPPLQPIAADLLNISSDGLHIRSVRPGTSAWTAKLEPGDRVLSVNSQPVSTDPSMRKYNDAVLKNGFSLVRPRVTVRTEEGREFTARIKPETACEAPARVIFSDNVNGHTDGSDVLITSTLMKEVPDDTNLALVVAHEMAHMIAGHFTQVPSQALELEADRMALVLMARAGYDIESAVAYWEGADHPHEGGAMSESSHPTTRERYKNFSAELDRIKQFDNVRDLEFNQ